MNDERMGKISASGAYVTYNCLGSLQMQAGITGDQSTPESIQGDEIHAALKSGELDDLDSDGRTITQQLQAMVDQALIEWGYPDPRIIKEVRFWMLDDNGSPIASSKPDFAAFARDGAHVLVCDYKSGYLPVTPAASNIQLRLQALTIASEFPEVTEILASTAQYRFVGRFDSVLYTRKELDLAKRELELVLFRASSPGAPLNAGDWCRYCKARGVCPAAAAWSLLPVTTVSTSPVTRDEAKALARRLTPAQMAVLRRHKPIIEAIMESVDDALREMPLEELNKVGLTLGKPARVVSYDNAVLVQELLVNAKVMTPEEFAGCVKVIIGRVQDLVLDRIPGTKEEAKKALKTILNPAETEHFRTAPLKALKESNE